jgi:hypothetical protein
MILAEAMSLHREAVAKAWRRYTSAKQEATEAEKAYEAALGAESRFKEYVKSTGATHE